MMRYIMFLPLILLAACDGNEDKYSVLKGSFRQSVIETGELQAINSSVMMMPRINSIYGYNLKIIWLTEHGKNVKKGEEVFKVDPSTVQKYIIEKRESLESEVAAANKLKVQNFSNFQDLKAQLVNEQSLFDIKKLERNKSAFESEGLRKVIELEYRQAEIRVNRLIRKLELRPKFDSLDYLIQQIKVKQKENDLNAALQALNQLNVCSPQEGIFVIGDNPRSGQTIRVGDEVYVGYVVARIPDIRSMKVKGIIRENDISRIKTGMDVIVRLEALPAVPFHGKVAKLSKVCVRQDQKNVFTTEVLLSENDPRLKPGMTVSCEYITYTNEDEMYVSNKTILEDNNHFYLFLRKRGKIRKTEVNTGPSNNLYTVISGDLKAGDNLVLPEDVLTR